MHVRKQTEQYAENTEITPPPLPRKKRNVVRRRRADSHLKAVVNDTERSELPQSMAQSDEKLSRAERNVPKVFELEHISESAAQEDSVLLKALKLRRNPIEKLAQSTTTLGLQLKPRVIQLSQVIGAKAGDLVQKLDQEKIRRHQNSIIGALIAITMFFVGFSLVSYNTTSTEPAVQTNVTAPPPPLKLDDVPLEYQPPSKAAYEKGPAPGEIDGKTQAANPPIEITPPPITTSTPKASSAVAYTSRRTWLRSKTSKRAVKVLRLPKNARLTTYPNFESKDGWALATTKRGHIGFVMTKYLKPMDSKR